MKFGRDRTPVTPEIAQAQQSARTRRRIIGSIVVLALLVIGYFVGAAFLPRWWARWVAQRVHDSFGLGALYGIGFGVLFTLIPLVILAGVFYRRLNFKARAAVIVLAFVAAIPNLLTLGVSTGTGGGAHAGQRKMDTDAPFFLGGTLIGAILAVLIFALGLWQYRAGRRVRSLKREAKQARKVTPDVPA